MAVVMIFAFLPMVNGQAYAADNVVSEIYITYDPDTIVLNTAYMESELNAITQKNMKYTPNNTFYIRGMSGLFFKYVNEDATYWFGTYNSEEPISTDKEYVIGFNGIDVLSQAGDWADALYACTDYTLASDCPGFSVYVNGIRRDDAILRCEEDGLADILIPMGPASTDPVIKSVTIEGNDVSVKVGTSHQFTATVTGNMDDKSLIWSVSDGNSAGTVISNEGVLTVGEDESAETLTVTATSNANNKKYDTKTVTVVQEDPVIESVTISPKEISRYPGTECSFKATVTGTEADKSVTWSVSNNNSANTVISDTGRLTISPKETAETLTVTVTSVKDPTKSDSATVTVLPFEKVSEIYFTYDENAVVLKTTYTEGELRAIAKDSLSYSPANTFYIRSGKGLFSNYTDEEGKIRWYDLFSSTDYISPEKEYAIGVSYIDVLNSAGKEWADALYECTDYTLSGDCPGFSVYVNGVKRDDVVMKCVSDGGADFYIPLKFKPGWLKSEGYWYFFNPDGTLAKNAWKKDSKGWCYLGDDGKMLTNGWAKDSKGWCWIGSEGYMVEKTQWLKVDGCWYHITKGYRDQNKWMKDSKGWCYLGEDGKMVTNGWAKDSKGWCYIGSEGYMVEKTQWVQVDGDWYHTTKGYRDQNKWMKDSHGWMYLGSDGKTVKNVWKKDSKGWCYLGDDGYMVSNGWAKDSIGDCWIGPDGYMVEETRLLEYEGDTYYIKAGYMQKNCTVEIGGVTYVFGEDGKLIP